MIPVCVCVCVCVCACVFMSTRNALHWIMSRFTLLHSPLIVYLFFTVLCYYSKWKLYRVGMQQNKISEASITLFPHGEIIRKLH